MNEKTRSYLKQYKKEKCFQICISLSKEHDADIIDFLSGEGINKQGTIKKLIREKIDNNAKEKLLNIVKEG